MSMIIIGTVVGRDADYKAQRKCYQLEHGQWWQQLPLLSARDAAAGSMTRRGWLVTGGWSADYTRLSSTEVLTPEGWVAGPTMELAVSRHCQVTVGDTVYLAGKGARRVLCKY